jgi:outer membrane lipoprotein-sorting protein
MAWNGGATPLMPIWTPSQTASYLDRSPKDGQLLERWPIESGRPEPPKPKQDFNLTFYVAFDPSGPGLGRPVVDELRRIDGRGHARSSIHSLRKSLDNPVMTELGELLALLHSAPRSYERLEAEFRAWCHTERAHEAAEASAEASPGYGGFVELGMEDDDYDDQGPESERVVRVWVDRPDRIRIERSGDGEEDSIVVRVGPRQWSYHKGWGAVVSDEDDMGAYSDELTRSLDPSPFIGRLDFDLHGRGTRAGREVLLVRAVPRVSGGFPSWDLDALGEGADEYELEVDAERGILLRAEARREGLPFELIEATSVAFDGAISAETFVFEPPAGEEVRRLGDVTPDSGIAVPLHEAVQRVPFKVFVPSRVPSDWMLTVMFAAGVEQLPSGGVVALMYRSPDAAVSLSIHQRADDRSRELPPERIERDGVPMWLRRRSEEWPQTQLALTLEGTAIDLFSTELDVESVIELATRLVPAPQGPPEI